MHMNEKTLGWTGERLIRTKLVYEYVQLMPNPTLSRVQNSQLAPTLISPG